MERAGYPEGGKSRLERAIERTRKRRGRLPLPYWALKLELLDFSSFFWTLDDWMERYTYVGLEKTRVLISRYLPFPF